MLQLERARPGIKINSPAFSLHKAMCTTKKAACQTRPNFWLHKHSERRHLPSILPSTRRQMSWHLISLPDRTLNQAYRQVRTAEVLLDVASTYTHLELFDKARSAMQEALDLCSRCYGNESERVAICHSQVASICSYEARAIRLKMVQSSSCYSLGTRVRVDGLQNYPQHNGLEGVVFKQENDSRVCVRLDQNNHELRLKLQNARPLVATADERKVLYTQLQDLADEGIASNTEYLRLQVKTHGVKHVNTARAHYSLGLALATIVSGTRSVRLLTCIKMRLIPCAPT